MFFWCVFPASVSAKVWTAVYIHIYVNPEDMRALRERHKCVHAGHQQAGLVQVAALYMLSLIALAWMHHDPLLAFQQLHRLASDIVVPHRSSRQPIMGPMRVVHVSTGYVTLIMRKSIQLLQEHSLLDPGEPWVKAVGTVALRQVRNPDLSTSIYSQNCNWTAQSVMDRSFEGSLAPTAWKYSRTVGLPPMQGSWCTVPDGGYYLGLHLQNLANHEQCRARPPAEVSDCAKNLLESIMTEFGKAGWIDSLTSTVTISLTMFDFRHGLASVVAVVAEKQTTASWLITSRVSLAYPRECMLTVLTLVVVLVITVLDLLLLQHLRLVKRMLLMALDMVLVFTLLTRLVLHFAEARLLGAATGKFLAELSGQPRRSGADPFGRYAGIEPLARIEQRITALETVWILSLLVKLLALEWYVTRGFTSFILILRRALRKSYPLVFTIVVLVVVHASIFYRFFGGHLRKFEFFDDSLSAMVGYTVGTFNHQEFFATSFTWKALFLLSAFILFLLGSQYVLTLFLAAAEAMNEADESVQVEEGRSKDPTDKDDSDDEVFLRTVKEELERTLNNRARGSAATTSQA